MLYKKSPRGGFFHLHSALAGQTLFDVIGKMTPKFGSKRLLFVGKAKAAFCLYT
jgi:hypothetical protein